MRLQESKPEYVASFLAFLVLITFALRLGFHFIKFPTAVLCLALVGLYSLYLILNIPYERKCHNVGVFSNCFLMLYFLVWTLLRDAQRGLAEEENQTIAISIFLAMAAISMVVNFVRTIVEFMDIIKGSEISMKKVNDANLITITEN